MRIAVYRSTPTCKPRDGEPEQRMHDRMLHGTQWPFAPGQGCNAESRTRDSVSGHKEGDAKDRTASRIVGVFVHHGCVD